MKANEKFYPAQEFKNYFQVSNVYYIQSGEVTHVKRKSVCGGKKLLGMKTWEVENPNYKTQEEWDKLVCKNNAQREKIITVSEYVWE